MTEYNNGADIHGRYIMKYEIGRGGMSKVYLAKDLKLNMDWAIKVIDLSKDSGNAKIYKIATEKEISLLKGAKHPALPRIVDFFTEDDKIYIVMDYIEGETLSDKLDREGRQKEEDVVKWIRAVCEVLNYLHTRENAIIYRDIKPSNIMLTPEGQIKLIDFGIARTYKSNSSSDTEYLGSRGYAAPEQCSMLGQSDERTDIYGVGATMYHLITGKHPDQPPYEIYPIRRWDKKFSRGVQEIIQKCVMTDPQYRYQTAYDLMEALDNYKKQDRYKGFRLLFICILLLLTIGATVKMLVHLVLGQDIAWNLIVCAILVLSTVCGYVFGEIHSVWAWFIGKEQKQIMRSKRAPQECVRESSTQQLDKMKGNIHYTTYHAGTETIKLGNQRMNRVNKFFQFYVVTSMKEVGISGSAERGEEDAW